MTGKKIVVGRPRLSVDFAIVLRMRDVENLGWSRMAEAYREITGQYISRDNIKRRYLEEKAQEGTTAATHVITSDVEWCVAVHRLDLYEQLIFEAIAYLQLIKLNDASQSERSHHESQLLFYQDRADRFWKRYKPGRGSRVGLNRRAVGPGIGNTDYTIARGP